MAYSKFSVGIEMRALAPEAARHMVERLETMRNSPNRMIIMDADHEVQELHMGLGQRRRRADAARCERA